MIMALGEDRVGGGEGERRAMRKEADNLPNGQMDGGFEDCGRESVERVGTSRRNVPNKVRDRRSAQMGKEWDIEKQRGPASVVARTLDRGVGVHVKKGKNLYDRSRQVRGRVILKVG